MKIQSEKLYYFRDISRTRIPCSMVRSVELDEYKVILQIDHFTADISNKYILFYGDDDTAKEDYTRLLKHFKKLGGK